MARKMTLVDLQESFERLTGDPSMRSLVAALRIGQEQHNMRGGLGKFKNLAIVAAVLAIIAFGASFIVQSNAAPNSLINKIVVGTQVISAGVVLICAVILWRVRSQLDSIIIEEQRIRKLTLEAAHKIAIAPGFFPSALPPETRSTLGSFIRREGYQGELEQILDVH